MECISLDSSRETHPGMGKKPKYAERIREKGRGRGVKKRRVGGERGRKEEGGERENSRSLCRYLFEFMAVTRRLGTRKREEERTRENEG